MSNTAEQSIIVSTETVLMDGSLTKLENGPIGEIVAAGLCGDLEDRRSNSISDIAKHLGSDNDETDIVFQTSTLIPEPNKIETCRSADDLMPNTGFPVEELSGPAVKMPAIDVQQSSSCVSMPNPKFDEEPIIQRFDDENPITTVGKPKGRSVWKRTKRFFRRLFCCGDVKVRRSSCGILVEPTNSAGDKIDFGSLPEIVEPELTASHQFTEDFLQQTTLRVEEFNDSIETNVQQSGCDRLDPQTTSQLEEINDPVETDVQPFRCHVEDPLNKSSESMLIHDVQTDSAGDKIDIGSKPVLEGPLLTDSPLFAEDFLPQTTLKVEELSGPIETDVQQSGCDLKGLPYECLVPLLIQDVQTDSVGDKINIGLTPNSHEQILMDSPRCADELQQKAALSVEEISGPVGTDVKHSNSDHLGSVSDLVSTEAKPKRRKLWKRLFCCAC